MSLISWSRLWSASNVWMICLLYSYSTWPSRVSRNFFLLRSISSDLNWRSNELICWLTADWVTWLICAALVKLSVSDRSQKTFRLSICMDALKAKSREASTGGVASLRQGNHAFDFPQQILAGERLAQIILVLGVFARRPQITAGAQNGHRRRHPANVIDQLPPAHPGHDKVGDDEINPRPR